MIKHYRRISLPIFKEDIGIKSIVYIYSSSDDDNRPVQNQATSRNDNQSATTEKEGCDLDYSHNSLVSYGTYVTAATPRSIRSNFLPCSVPRTKKPITMVETK